MVDLQCILYGGDYSPEQWPEDQWQCYLDMSRKYPEILSVARNGMRRSHGKLRNICPISGTYRKFAEGIADRMVRRYCAHPAAVTAAA